MRTTRGVLADGRDIVYYHRGDAATPVVEDRRQLPAAVTASELRHDPIMDEWVTIAPHRRDRTHLPAAEECPLCPSRDGRRTEIPAPDYEVAVFENRFPALALDPPEVPATVDPGSDLLPRRPARGRCEVICFTPDHRSSFARLSHRQVRLVVDAWADRTRELSRLAGIEQVFCFENRGEEIGVTLHHPHGQIYAYPFVTPRTGCMLGAARRHRGRTGRNLFADVLAAERRAGTRVVAESGHWTAFVPAAARWPVEVHLYPHRQVPDLPALTDAERDDLVGVHLDLVRRVEAYHDAAMPYIAGWHQAPVNQDRDLLYLHLELLSTRRSPTKLKYLAGSEISMGALVNDVEPEVVAARLRQLAP